MKRLFITALLLLTASACAGDLYDIHPMSESQLQRMYLDSMVDICRYTDNLWHQSEFDPHAGYWGTGRSDWNNEGTRAVSAMVLTTAALIKQSDALSPALRRQYMDRAKAAIRYTVSTHITGSQKCTDGKQWGNSWQSAYWTGNLVFGAWLMWDDLDADLRAGVERVVVYEADRFLNTTPPGNRWADTKAEENGWDMLCIAAAVNMFPSHPHAALWRAKTIEYMMNTLSTPADMSDSSLVDGRPVKDWVHAANTHPDFTVENHNIFHPAYAVASGGFLGQAGLLYVYAKAPVPQAASHHLIDNWRMLQPIMMPYAEWHFPQGMDWELHSDLNVHYLAWLATYCQDPVAAGMERTVLQYIRGRQKIDGGSLAGPGSPLQFAREAVCAERLTYSYLSHRLLKSRVREQTLSDIERGISGVRHYTLADVIVHRTNSKLFTFSWKNRLMGMISPIGAGHAGNPYLVTPYRSGMVGTFKISDGKDSTKVEEHSWRRTADGFETQGIVSLFGDRFRQEIKVISIGEKTVVYQDRVIALSNVTVNCELGVPIGIENDQYNGAKRILYSEAGQAIYPSKNQPADTAIAGGWVNIDGRLGVVQLGGSGFNYKSAPNYNGNAIIEDILYASYNDHQRSYKAGEQVAQRTVVYFMETSPEQTSDLFRKIRIQPTVAGREMLLDLPEGGQRRIGLM